MVDEYKVETREDPEETKAQEGIEDRQKDSEMNGVVQASLARVSFCQASLCSCFLHQ